MSKKIDKEKKEKYEFTLKGLFISLGLDLEQAGLLADGVELHLRRHYKGNGYPAIVLGDKGFEITSVGRAK